MPVIVVGADTPAGRRVVQRFSGHDREVRAFVSDPEIGAALRQLGVKVALGDVSDDSHVSGACLNTFSAILITEAARDDRERSFADSPDRVLAAWAEAVVAARVKRVIWVGDGEIPPTRGIEVGIVSETHPDLTDEVYRLDEVEVLS